METLVRNQIVMVIVVLAIVVLCSGLAENREVARGVTIERATQIASILVVGVVLFMPLFMSAFCIAAAGLGFLFLAIIAAIGWGAYAVIDANAFWGAIVAAVMADLFVIIISALKGVDLTGVYLGEDLSIMGIVSLLIAPVINFGILYGLPRLIIN